jgi:hypothetical protein
MNAEDGMDDVMTHNASQAAVHAAKTVAADTDLNDGGDFPATAQADQEGVPLRLFSTVYILAIKEKYRAKMRVD